MLKKEETLSRMTVRVLTQFFNRMQETADDLIAKPESMIRTRSQVEVDGRRK